MFDRKSTLWAASLVVVAFMVVPQGGALLSSHDANGSTPVATPSTHRHVAPATITGPSDVSRAATQQRILSTIHAANVPSRDVFLPNFNAQETRSGGLVGPTYHHSPAPIGIAAMGLTNTTGNMTGYVLNSQSFEGSLTFNSLSAFYLDDDATDYVGAQLNTVVTNVTILGNSNNSFWNQNVITYSARTNFLQFIDNIWNFSSPSFYMSPDVFNQTSPNGTLVAPAFYYAIGPLINVSMPFTVNLYINTSIVNQGGLPYDIVWFNYTVLKSNLWVAGGTYDWAIFNSQSLANPTPVIPQPEYQVNGINLSPTGYLPYDAELVLCGPGGGSTTSLWALSASMHLWFLNGTTGTYQDVPSAFAYGTDTGETIEGVSEWYDAANNVFLGPGPTLPFALWNASPTSVPGHITVAGPVSPTTSFVFMNASSTFNWTYAAWAPVPLGGTATYQLPLDNYSGEVEMSNYDPVTFNVVGSIGATWAINGVLTPNFARGVYTPLIAFSNAQLAELSQSGTGTAIDPYILMNNQVGSLDPIFGMMNDFTFPVFPGLMLVHTTDYVVDNQSATFWLNYAGRTLLNIEAQGLPTSNYLQFQLYGTSHVTIWNSSISGWFDGANLAGFPLASLMLWNTTGTLVGANQFWSQGTTLLIYGGGGSTIWGNWFETSTNLSDPNFAAAVMDGTFAFGPQLFCNGDTVYNNVFYTQISAYSPAFTIYTETFTPANNITWINAWNISLQPATNVHMVNGFSLNGSITGSPYQGGNLWWSYGHHGYYVPFDGYGLIAIGGDFFPLGGNALTFGETGLASPGWGFTIDGLSVFTTDSATTIAVPDGSHAWSVTPIAGYTTSPASGSSDVGGGAPSSVAIVFTAIPTLYNLTLTESGLPDATVWSASVNGASMSSNTTAIVFPVPDGNYTWGVTPVPGRILSHASGTVAVSGADASVEVTFSAPPPGHYTVSFVELGLSSGTSWNVTFAGTPLSSKLNVIVFVAPNGTYPYTVGSVPGFTASSAGGNATVSGSNAIIDITFVAQPGTLSGTVSPGEAQVWVDGQAVTVGANGAFSVSVAPGLHSVEATAGGYYAYFNNVSVDPASTATLAVALVSNSGANANSNTLSGTNLALLAGIGFLAFIFLIGMIYFWSRSRRPPVVMKPEPSPGGSSTSDASSGKSPP